MGTDQKGTSHMACNADNYYYMQNLVAAVEIRYLMHDIVVWHE